MIPLPDAQEQARRFNENEAVQRCYEMKRLARKSRRNCGPETGELLDDLDWREAELECRTTRAIGTPSP